MDKFKWFLLILFLVAVFFTVKSKNMIELYEKRDQYSGVIVSKPSNKLYTFKVKFDNGVTEDVGDIDPYTHSIAIEGQRASFRLDHVPGESVYVYYPIYFVLMTTWLTLLIGGSLMLVFYYTAH